MGRPGVLERLRLVADEAAAPDAAVLLASLPLPVVVLDAAGRFRFVNPEAEQFFGISAQQAAAMSLSDLLPADNRLFALIAQLRASGATVSGHELALESPLLSHSGVAVQGVALAHPPGAVLLAFQDAPAARVIDRGLAHRAAARSVAGMAALLAHEVKNPLSGIRGAAQLLERSVAAGDRELAVLIREEVDRIKALLERMDVFGERRLDAAPVNIHRVLDQVRRLAEAGFGAGIRFVEEYDPSLPAVLGSRDQLLQVLLNLVKNAAEAIAAGPVGGARGEIVLHTAFQHGVRLAAPGVTARQYLPLVVAVRDNGPGIAEDLRAQLFDPFVTTKQTGSGLGLALVAKIVADHGGMIEVDGTPGRCEFRLHLPMHAEGAGA